MEKKCSNSFKNQVLDISRKEKSYLGRPSEERALLDNKAKVNNSDGLINVTC